MEAWTYPPKLNSGDLSIPITTQREANRIFKPPALGSQTALQNPGWEKTKIKTRARTHHRNGNQSRRNVVTKSKGHGEQQKPQWQSMWAARDTGHSQQCCQWADSSWARTQPESVPACLHNSTGSLWGAVTKETHSLSDLFLSLVSRCCLWQTFRLSCDFQYYRHICW